MKDKIKQLILSMLQRKFLLLGVMPTIAFFIGKITGELWFGFICACVGSAITEKKIIGG